MGTIVAALSIEEDNRYKILKKEALLFDQNYLKELSARYEITAGIIHSLI